jgi:hypothetical protein
MMEKFGVETYLKSFPVRGDVRLRALERAHEIRAFEIDLYWKRAGYFWAILAIAFAGYFAGSKYSSKFANAIISDLGLVISLCWYLVNRGGAAWQQNWEFHIDLLEDELTGPLYKTRFNRQEYSFLDISGPYPFSPAQCNALVSLFVALSWMGLFTVSNWRLLCSDTLRLVDYIVGISLGAGAVLMCAAMAYLSTRGGPETRVVAGRTRRYRDTEQVNRAPWEERG